jgi:hypothetical protein
MAIEVLGRNGPYETVIARYPNDLIDIWPRHTGLRFARKLAFPDWPIHIEFDLYGLFRRIFIYRPSLSTEIAVDAIEPSEKEGFGDACAICLASGVGVWLACKSLPPVLLMRLPAIAGAASAPSGL